MAFKSGVSGNPSGRPKQILSTSDLRKRLGKNMPDILRILIQKAKDGDLQAIKIILDRTHPPLKAQAMPVTINHGGNLSETGGNILTATLNGQISTDIGAALINAVLSQVKLVETCDLITRIEALEKSAHET